MHNKISHKHKNHLLDLLMMKICIVLSNKIIIHSNMSKQILAVYHKNINGCKIFYIPHGNYLPDIKYYNIKNPDNKSKNYGSGQGFKLYNVYDDAVNNSGVAGFAFSIYKNETIPSISGVTNIPKPNSSNKNPEYYPSVFRVIDAEGTDRGEIGSKNNSENNIVRVDIGIPAGNSLATFKGGYICAFYTLGGSDITVGAESVSFAPYRLLGYEQYTTDSQGNAKEAVRFVFRNYTSA